MTFLVVQFRGTDAIAAVPSCWTKVINNKMTSSWPEHLVKYPNKFRRAIQESQCPDGNYTQYEIDILKSFDRLEDANKYCRKKEEEISASSSSQKSLGRGKRKIVKNKKFISHFQSDTDSDTPSDLSLVNITVPAVRQIVEADVIAEQSQRPLPSTSSCQSTPFFDERAPVTTSPQMRNILEPVLEQDQSGNVLNNISINQVAKLQLQILNRMKNLEARFEDVIKSHDLLGTLPDNIPVVLPLSNVEDFKNFNVYLQNNDNFKLMFTYLKSLCNNHLGQSINYIMKEIMTNKLAVNFNYFGKKPKIKFSQTKMENLIFLTVKVAFKNNINREEYRQHVMKWLKYAPQREKYQKRRVDVEDSDENRILEQLLL